MKMKNRTVGKLAILLKSIALTLIASLAVAGRLQAQSVTWLEKDDYVGSSTIKWAQPKLAGDANGDFVVVGYNLGPLSYWTGFNPRNETTLDGAGNSTEYAAVGVTPSVAMVNLSPWTPYNAVVDVRQGGQNYGAALWSDVAVYQGPPIGSALTFSDGLQYDNG